VLLRKRARFLVRTSRSHPRYPWNLQSSRTGVCSAALSVLLVVAGKCAVRSTTPSLLLSRALACGCRGSTKILAYYFNRSRRAMSSRRTHALTVPTGIPRYLEISACVRPSIIARIRLARRLDCKSASASVCSRLQIANSWSSSIATQRTKAICSSASTTRSQFRVLAGRSAVDDQIARPVRFRGKRGRSCRRPAS